MCAGSWPCRELILRVESTDKEKKQVKEIFKIGTWIAPGLDNSWSTKGHPVMRYVWTSGCMCMLLNDLSAGH